MKLNVRVGGCDLDIQIGKGQTKMTVKMLTITAYRNKIVEKTVMMIIMMVIVMH